MTIEIHQQELESLIQERLKTGEFQSVEQLLMNALKALSESKSKGEKQKTRAEAIAHIKSSRKGNKLPEGMTLKELINQGRD